MLSTATQIAAQVQSRERSAVEVVRAAFAHIDARNSELDAFIAIEHEAARQQAAEVDRRIASGDSNLPLAGIPIALKDNICVHGMRTTCGSKILENFTAPYDAHVAKRLRDAGAVIVAKTNLDEFAMGSSTENSALAVTRNPWNTKHVPGGSSGGSAVAVAAGMVPAALGSDTGGSIRQPASFCGVVGLKPTYGRVSRYGLVAYGSSLDQIGPLTRTAEDAALILSVIAGADARDATCLDAQVPDYRATLGGPLAGVRIGIADEYFGEGLGEETRAAINSALAVLREQGAITADIHLPHTRYGIACYYLIATAEASSNLARYDGVHYGHRAAGATDIVDLYAASREEGFGAEVKRRIMLGTYALSSGYYDQYYARAMKVRTLLRRDFDQAFKQCDVICSPVAPTPAFAFGEKTADPLAMYLADVYTITANLAGIPALSVPCGFDPRGLPIGMQFMGRPLAEGLLLNLAHQYQQATEHHLRTPPAAAQH